ncbi:hypothetical protein SDC9_21718 [bioreactor metagenome]|uniref:D-alanyl-D-alanine carboxypeptidase-like core domain-containing protein n=1 Tax=bioreactor metagenome TaxID=1076179 RepID=A0A644UAI3_9ZZZZ|nr:D-alanyl-D-alanine carboxypeptidase family protein [Candidatus Elulimicrobiales bacterium]
MKKFFVFFFLIFTLFSFNISFSQNQSQDQTDVYSRQETYDYVSSFDGTSSSTTFDNTDTGGISSTMNYLLTILAVVIIVLIVFRVIQGAVIKGTLDNIYQQTKGRSFIQNAGIALIIFIFSYAILSFINPKLTGWTLATKYANTALRRMSPNTETCNPNDKYKSPNNIMDMLMQDEGSRNSIYTDTTGNPSIGVGFNLKRADAATVKNDLLRAEIPEDTVNKLLNYDRTVTIEERHIKKLLEADFESHKQMAIAFAGGQSRFSEHPENIQNVLINMTFNMGSGGISSFVNLKKALDVGDYMGVAREIVDSRYCGQVGGRCSRLANLAAPQYCVEYQKELAESMSLFSSNGGKGGCVALTNDQLEQVGTKRDGGCVPAGPIYLRKDVAQKFKEMQAAALSEANIKLEAYVGYRDDAAQVCLYNQMKGKSAVATPCSMGGNGSNHSNGTAIDLTNASIGGCGKVGACNTKEFLWLKENGGRWGFYNKLGTTDNVHWSLTGK